MSTNRRSGFTRAIAGDPPTRLLADKPRATTKPAPATAITRSSRGVNSGIAATIEGDFIVVRLPLFPKEKRRASGSGKSVLCASTHGPKIVRQHGVDGLVPVEIDGKALRVIASAFIPAENKVTSKE